VDNGKKSNNSWMISFAPYDEPKYAICSLVQNAGSGGAVCGPLSHLIYRGLFARDEGLKLPLKPQTEFAGNDERIDVIELPTDILAAIDASAAEDLGETGEEAVGIAKPVDPTASTTTTTTPIPTITPEADAEGTIPRALPVRER
jgi:penicillin-binding protein 2